MTQGSRPQSDPDWGGAANAGVLSLAGLCEPRIEPEIVFGLRGAPPPDCTADRRRRCCTLSASCALRPARPGQTWHTDIESSGRIARQLAGLAVRFE